MTNDEARAEFDSIIGRLTDPDTIATTELLREFFTNPGFRKELADLSFQQQEDNREPTAQ